MSPFVFQDASGGDGGGSQQQPSQEKGQESAGQPPASEGGNLSESAKPEPMETDEPAAGMNSTEAGLALVSPSLASILLLDAASHIARAIFLKSTVNLLNSIKLFGRLLVAALVGQRPCKKGQQVATCQSSVNEWTFACDGAGPSEERGGGLKEAGVVLDERWRWRVLSAKALPHFSGPAALMAAPQATQLQVLDLSIAQSHCHVKMVSGSCCHHAKIQRGGIEGHLHSGQACCLR